MTNPSLTSRVKLQARGASANDGAGNAISGWIDIASERAEIKTARGGESVVAARLAGREVFVIRVRANAVTRALTAANRVLDLDSGRTLGILSVESAGPRDPYVKLYCESGRADG